MGSQVSTGRLRGELTEFVGRPVELALLRQALGTARLVALTGGGLPPSQLASVHRALGEAVRRGGQIHYVQRSYAPQELRCLCLFDAAGPDLVRHVTAPDGRNPVADLGKDKPDDRY